MNVHQVPRRTMVRPLEYASEEERVAFEAMLSDERWDAASTFREQCRLIKEYLYNDNVKVAMARLGSIFGGVHCVEKQFKKIERDEIGPVSIGRPSLLTHEEIEVIKAPGVKKNSNIQAVQDSLWNF